MHHVLRGALILGSVAAWITAWTWVLVVIADKTTRGGTR